MKDNIDWRQIFRVEGEKKKGISPADLELVLENLDLSWVNTMVWDLYDHSQLGQRPFPPQAMLKALLLQRLKNIPSERKLAKFLEKEQRWAKLCGFTRRKGTPTHACFSQFRKRLGKERFDAIFNELVRRGNELGAVNGEKVATDTTSVGTNANPKKGSDKDASWGYDTKDGLYYGYKAHICVDVEEELPIAVITTSAERHPSPLMPPLLEKARANSIDFNFAIGDSGYDACENYNAVVEDFEATPVIALNVRNYKGIGKGQRSLLSLERDYRLDPPIPRGSERWSKLYGLRTGSERVNSRLKELLGLEQHKFRGLEAVSVHVLLCCSAMLGIAIVAEKLGLSRLKRSITAFA